MKTIKTSLVLLSSVFVLAACGQNNTAGSTAQTTQAEQPTTTVPTTQANNKQSDHQSSGNKQNNANSIQQSNSAIPKDGEATYKLEEIGKLTILQFFFKNDIVYKLIGIYTYNPKLLGKSDEEVVQLLNKDQALYEGVTGITSSFKKKDGQYIQTVTLDYQTMDWKELHRRNPNQFPGTEPRTVKFSENAANLVKNGFVKQ